MKTRIIKTVTPYIVGYLVSLLTTWGLEVSDELRADITNALTLLFGSVYYVLVALLAKRWPKLEALLGSKQRPEYVEG